MYLRIQCIVFESVVQATCLGLLFCTWCPYLTSMWCLKSWPMPGHVSVAPVGGQWLNWTCFLESSLVLNSLKTCLIPKFTTLPPILISETNNVLSRSKVPYDLLTLSKKAFPLCLKLPWVLFVPLLGESKRSVPSSWTCKVSASVVQLDVILCLRNVELQDDGDGDGVGNDVFYDETCVIFHHLDARRPEPWLFALSK